MAILTTIHATSLLHGDEGVTASGRQALLDRHGGQPYRGLTWPPVAAFFIVARQMKKGLPACCDG
jgi:hypothetical protein